MGRKQVVRVGIVVLGLSAVVGGFQNCSEARFTQASDASSTSLSVSSLPATNNPIAPLVCSVGQNATPASEQYFPTQCLKDPQLPANTLGLEMSENYLLGPTAGAGGNTFTLLSDDDNGTSKDVQLYIEVATYLAPDTVVLYAVDSKGVETKILDVCNAATYSKGDPSGGTKRPYSDTILQFNVVLPKGTRALKYDFTAALTPTYVGVWGLNEFSEALANGTNNPFAAIGKSGDYRVMNGLPTALNDNADPATGAQICN